MLNRLMLLVAASFFLFASAALAEGEKKAEPAAKSPVKYSLKEKKMLKHKNAEMARHERNLNDRCGSKIKVSVDWDSYKLADKLAPSVEGAASGLLDQIGYSVCSDEDGKAAVIDAIKEIRFVWSEEDAVDHKLADGVLTEGIWVKPGIDGYVVKTNPTLKEWLMNNL